MKPSTVRLAVPLLSCALFLTACPGPAPTPIDLKVSPAALNGTWSGTLWSALDLSQTVLGGDALYAVHREGGYVPAADAGLRSVQSVVKLDAATGAERRRVPAPAVQELAYRPASAGLPARLLALGQVAFNPADPTNRGFLLELDPDTLGELRRTALPAVEGDYRFSTDGRWLVASGKPPLDTRTGQAVSLPAAVQAQLGQPQVPAQRYVSWSAGGEFVSVGGRATPGVPWTTRLYSAGTGATFEGAAQHAPACTVPSGQLDTPFDVAELSDGGAAMAYLDGTVELRRGDDTLRQLVTLGGCTAHTLRVDGDVLTFARQAQSGDTLGTLRLSSGQVLEQREIGLHGGRPVGEGTAVAGGFTASGPVHLTLERTSGTVWTLQGQSQTLKLETRITSVTPREYTSVGTATLNGEALEFFAKANSGSYTFGAQMSPPVPVSWTGQLQREDGTVVARLAGQHGPSEPRQAVQLQFPDRDRAFAFTGELHR